MAETKEASEAFSLIVDLALAHGVRDLGAGSWTHDVDDRWRVAVNGSKAREFDGLLVQPFHAVVWFNGWPAGLLSPFDGVIAAGEAANEDTLIEALNAALLRIRDTPGGEG